MEKRFIENTIEIEERANEDGSKADYIIGYAIAYDTWSVS